MIPRSLLSTLAAILFMVAGFSTLNLSAQQATGGTVSVNLTETAKDAAKTDAQATAEAAANKAEAAAEKAETAAEKAEAAADKAENAAEAAAEAAPAQRSPMVGTFWALVPPLVAIVLALITKEAYSSLFIGVFLGACFVGAGNPLAVMDAMINDGFIEAVKGTAGVFLFLVQLGILVALINRTGAAAAFGRWASTHVKSRVGASLATFFLGVLIFIDDYFNCLTVGSVMLPVTDAKKISRAKLAYLIDATAAPICMIAPISSWAAAVSSYADGTSFSGLELFCRAIPYNFYSLLTFVFIIGISVLKVDFGPMAIHERNALEKGDLFTAGGEVDNGVRPLENAKGRVIDLIIPILLLMGICYFALIYVGGILEEGKGFIAAFSDTDATVALPWGGMIVLVLVIIYLIVRQVIPAREAMKCIPEGFIAMVPAILILTLATSLKNMTSVLEAREFIHGLMEGAAGSLHSFLPCVIFLVGCILSFATGTSWGTFGILIPIVVSIFPVDSPLLFIGMSACLAGAVCGDHCSPISDTTIMSSAGARCEHINHVSTQLPYAIAVAVLSFVGFVIAGFTQSWFVSFPATAILTIGLLLFIKTRNTKKA